MLQRRSPAFRVTTCCIVSFFFEQRAFFQALRAEALSGIASSLRLSRPPRLNALARAASYIPSLTSYRMLSKPALLVMRQWSKIFFLWARMATFYIRIWSRSRIQSFTVFKQNVLVSLLNFSGGSINLTGGSGTSSDWTPSKRAE